MAGIANGNAAPSPMLENDITSATMTIAIFELILATLVSKLLKSLNKVILFFILSLLLQLAVVFNTH